MMKYSVLPLSLCYFSVWSFAVSSAQSVVAHRGASFDAPENTRASFLLAWEKDADAIEGDFHLTRDQKIVCFHDATTKRVSDVNFRVAQSTLAELQKLDVGTWKDKRFSDERMPSLGEVIALVPSDRSFFIEIKSGPDIVPFLQRALQESCAPLNSTIIISFNENVIRAVKIKMPQYKAYWLVAFHKDEHSNRWRPTHEEIIDTARAICANGVDLNANTEVVNTQLVDLCHRAGLSVHVWTVDDLDEAIKLQKMGVDSITTNRPGYLRRGLFPQKPALPFPSSVLSPSSIPANSEAQLVPTTVP